MEHASCELDQHLSFVLYSTSLAMNKVYKSTLKKLGLTFPQFLIMNVLWEQDDISISMLSKQLFQDLGALSPVLKRMETMGLLSRHRSPEDERQIRLVLTEQGRNLQQHADTLSVPVLENGGLDGEHGQQLREQLLGIRRLLHKMV